MINTHQSRKDFNILNAEQTEGNIYHIAEQTEGNIYRIPL